MSKTHETNGEKRGAKAGSGQAKPEQPERDLGVNRKAHHDYFFLDRFEAGIVLTGTEVKSARNGRVSLVDGYAELKNGELWLHNCHISPYSHGNYMNHEALRTRKLLIHKQELHRLAGNTRERGLTLVPLRIYLKRGKVKAEIAIAKGKKEWDKRETIRRREADMEAKQAVRASKAQRQ
jgi:SsrA-binding protein